MDNCQDTKGTDNCKKDDGRANLALEFAEAKQATPAFNSNPADSRNPGRSTLPPYMLEELSKRNPDDDSYKQTIVTTRQLEQQGPFMPRIAPGTNGEREVYDAEGKETHPGKKARFEGDAATGKTDVDNVYDFTGIVREYFKTVHGKNSIDNKGMKMVSTVNYGDNFQNAFWNGKQMTYGSPSDKSPFKSFVLLDVTGHEITHGITQNTSGTLYFGQAGALNEHLSDVFGEVIQQRHRNQSADQADWVIGDGIWKDGINGTGIRNMLNPGTAFNDAKIGKDPQPAHMKDYIKTWKDMGGVHLNSGIPNRAFALFAKTVGGNAWETPAKVWYEAAQNIGMWPSFSSFADETVAAAKKLGYGPDVVNKLKQAWSDVGVNPIKGAKDTDTPGDPSGKTPEQLSREYEEALKNGHVHDELEHQEELKDIQKDRKAG